LEVAAVRVERKHPHTTTYKEALSQKRDDLVQKEVKAGENRRSAQQTFKKLGRQIRCHVKPNSAKKYGITRVDVKLRNDVWKQLMGKDEVEEQLIARNVERFLHAGSTPF
jgi:cytochrome c-type biogenesis protein CcmH/NrfF